MPHLLLVLPPVGRLPARTQKSAAFQVFAAGLGRDVAAFIMTKAHRRPAADARGASKRPIRKPHPGGGALQSPCNLRSAAEDATADSEMSSPHPNNTRP